MTSFRHLSVLSPKRESLPQAGRASWYPYYAGFSTQFAHSLLVSAKLDLTSQVNDPWNGSGTTTAAAAGLGYCASGFDLNPVMVLAAKARMLSKREENSLVPLAETITRVAQLGDGQGQVEDEPLCTWFVPSSASAVRLIERAIHRVLIGRNGNPGCGSRERARAASDIAAFFYVALFRAVRELLRAFLSSNPTWVRKPAHAQQRLRPAEQDITTGFHAQVRGMAEGIKGDTFNKDSEVTIDVGSSDCLPLADRSVDFVLSSPPYCTRIDYAVATMPELAILGYGLDTEFDALRRRLIGTSTVPKVPPSSASFWGGTCLSFLEKVQEHRSKASRSYYLKNHLQYFDSIYGSLREIRRILKPNGTCVLVVQDSYYKDIHNDLPQIFTEMAGNNSMKLRRREDFRQTRTMAAVNPKIRRYRDDACAVEAVLCFQNT